MSTAQETIVSTQDQLNAIDGKYVEGKLVIESVALNRQCFKADEIEIRNCTGAGTDISADTITVFKSAFSMLVLNAGKITVESSVVREMFLWGNQDLAVFRQAHVRRLEMQNVADFFATDSWIDKLNADKVTAFVAMHAFIGSIFVMHQPKFLHFSALSVNKANIPVVDMGSDGEGRHLNVFSSDNAIIITYGKQVFLSFEEAAEWWKHNQEMLNLLTFAVESLKEKVAELQEDADQ
jgi:hypothetical protein